MIEKLNLPEDIKKLNIDEMNTLCLDIRKILIETVSKRGGHLASNLGIVELTVALHKAFSSPYDKILFDVGHQSYVHKILTGRLENIDTLRTFKGVSGFPNPLESVHDIFITGHSSTSVSSALGLSVAEQLVNGNAYTIAVIGDGSLTGGLAYEGMNNAGKTGKKLIVILNDNEMSISPNVGGMQRYLSKIRLRPSYISFKKRFKKTVLKIPGFGKWLHDKFAAMKTVLKDYFFKSTFFEQMGFYYLGPCDGHNIKQLIDIMNYAKDIDAPVLLHVRTIKGKGYSPAEENPGLYHGVDSFDLTKGIVKKDGERTFSAVFGDKICQLAEKDKRICAVTAAMADGTKLTQFAKQFPARFFDVGIAEAHAVTFAAGLAKNGMIPVFAVYSTFLQRAYDEILHDVALQGLKVVFILDRAGIVGEDGATHHGIFDVSYLSSIPGVTVLSPICENELEGMLEAACFSIKGPVAIRYPKSKADIFKTEFSNEPYDIFQAADFLCETLIISYGREFCEVLEAASELYRKGIKCDLMKLNQLTMLDFDDITLKISSYERIFFYEEAAKRGGVGEQFGACLLEKGYKGEYKFTAIENFVEHGDLLNLLKNCGLHSSSIVFDITAKCVTIAKNAVK